MSQGTGALSFGYGNALAAAIQLSMPQRWDSLTPGSWLGSRAVSGLQHRDVTISHRTQSSWFVFCIHWLQQDLLRLNKYTRAACLELLDPPGE